MLEYVLEQSRLSAAQTNSSNATAETTTPSSTVTNIGTLRNPIQLDKPQVPNVITLYEDDEEDEDDFVVEVPTTALADTSETSTVTRTNSQFDDLSAYILQKTGNVTVNAIGAQRSNRGWGENVSVDLHDIVDVQIDKSMLNRNLVDFARAKFHAKHQGPKALQFRGKPLTHPLLAKLKSSALVKAAIQMSKNITGFIGTRKTSKAGFSHAEKIFHFVLEDICDETTHDNIPLLWDEIYCQVMKVSVLESGVDINVSTKSWQLFAVLASVFPCSKELFPYAMSFCEKVKASAPEHIYALAWFVFHRFVHCLLCFQQLAFWCCDSAIFAVYVGGLMLGCCWQVHTESSPSWSGFALPKTRATSCTDRFGDIVHSRQ